MCLPLLGCFHPVPLISLGGLLVSRGVSEPWKNEEWNTCYVCWHRSRRVILFLVLALLCPSPGHQPPLGVVLSSRVPHTGTEQGEVMKVQLLVKVGWAGAYGVAGLRVVRSQCFPPALCRVFSCSWLGHSGFLSHFALFPLHLSMRTWLPLPSLIHQHLGKGQMIFSLVPLKTWLTLFLGIVGFLYLTFQWILYVDMCTATSPQGQMGSAFPFQKTSIPLALGGEFMSYLATSSFFLLYQKIEYFVFLRQVMFCSSG